MSRDDSLFAFLKDDIRKSLSELGSPVQLLVNTILVLSPDEDYQLLVKSPSGLATYQSVDHPSGGRVQTVVLEEWTLALDLSPDFMQGSNEPSLALIYKYCVSLLRSLYSLLHYLPAWKLHRNLVRNERMRLITTVHMSPVTRPDNEVELDQKLFPEDHEPAVFKFMPITIPSHGDINLRVRYRPYADFKVDLVSPSENPSLSKAPKRSSSPAPPFEPNVISPRPLRTMAEQIPIPSHSTSSSPVHRAGSDYEGSQVGSEDRPRSRNSFSTFIQASKSKIRRLSVDSWRNVKSSASTSRSGSPPSKVYWANSPDSFNDSQLRIHAVPAMKFRNDKLEEADRELEILVEELEEEQRLTSLWNRIKRRKRVKGSGTKVSSRFLEYQEAPQHDLTRPISSHMSAADIIAIFITKMAPPPLECSGAH
ncbi:autophagy-related protein 13 [Ceratobasidium sp. AG-Ba]|nr:autophagy-related protein 13 [Ceratobasidium sp. AG-Ba]